MITCRAWAGKRYAVLGLARSGAATVRALVASGAEVVAWDDNPETWKDALLPIKNDSRDGTTAQPNFRINNWQLARDLTGFEAIVVSPGVPLNKHPVSEKARRYGLPIIGDIELFAQARAELPPHKVVGITGTNGKSTTTALVHHILQTAGVPSLMGGNIGLPILGQDPLPAGGVYVLELSSYQIDLTQTLDCDVAVLLNITPDHLDRYDGIEGYVASKARLFEMQSAGSKAVVVIRDAFTTGVVEQVGERLFPTLIGKWDAEGVSIAEGFYSLRDAARDYTPMHLHVLGQNASRQDAWPSLQGPHNAANVVAAVAVVEQLGKVGQSFRKLHDALRTFTGLPHRTELIATRAGVAFVDDSKATNPDSTAPALAAFPRVHWILGGRAKGDDLDACLPHLSHVARAYTIGEAGPVFARVLDGKVPVEEAGTLDRAVASAAAHAGEGDTVLLSPAAASFDQFRDYEHRGQAFRQLVEAL